MKVKPVVVWQSPESIPNVPKTESKLFWIAIRYKRKSDTKWITVVFDAQYVNKPLEYSDDDNDFMCPLDEDHFTTIDGEPLEAIGWYNTLYHPEFSSYYEPIVFNDKYELLGWAEYEKPDFNPNQT